MMVNIIQTRKVLLSKCFQLICFISIVVNVQAQKTNDDIVRPNIVWITCEDMSPHLSCFGEKAIETPNLDALAKDGVKYTNVYTVAGVCAPSRCGIITAMYPMSIGGDNMRNYAKPNKKGVAKVANGTMDAYSIMPPEYVKCYSEYLRKEGYYCTNNPKEDYQFQAPVTAWDESSAAAHWKNAPKDKPFFAVFNLEVTHESQVWKRDSLPLEADPAKVLVPPYYPDVPEVRHDIARQLSNVKEMDRQAGKLIQQLKEAGLYDNTIIFFYSDHGDGLPYVKREITKRGLYIPMIIKFPKQANAGKVDDQMISAIDFGPTVLSLAGVAVPKYMDGQAFLGAQKRPERKYIFAARDRMDEKVDRVRTVFDGRYQYIKNYMPQLPYYQDLAYRYDQPSMKKILQMRDAKQLNATQMRWFQSKPEEEFYDTKNDPYELKNLAKDPAYKSKFNELKKQYDEWMASVGDENAMDEKALIKKWWNGKDELPITATPTVKRAQGGYLISCATPGTSIGFKINSQAGKDKAEADWQVYNYQTLNLQPGDQLSVQVQRIGFKASGITYTIPSN